MLIAALKIFYDIIPGVSQETSWTLTNISYMFGSFLMFHWVRGIPFEFNAGAYDNLNMWEQIDNGDQYTPTKKFLLCVPIVLFLLSTHYTHYDLTYFTINVLATLGVVIPKLPFVRVFHFQTVESGLFDLFKEALRWKKTTASKLWRLFKNFQNLFTNTSLVTSPPNRLILRLTRGVIVHLLLSLFVATLASLGLRSSLLSHSFPPFPTLRLFSSKEFLALR